GLGLNQTSAVTITFGPPGGVPAKTTNLSVNVAPGGPVNWNRNAVSTDVNVVRDISNMTNASGGCPPSPPCSPTTGSTGCEFLEGSNDWQILQLNMRASTDFADGVSQNFDPPVTNGTQAVTYDAVLDMSHDIIDIKPADKNNTINLSTTATFSVAIFSR